tara:strand:+ start:127 stop:1869 length:1743 start_codon:yes stop_codon:yes gene_type:complete
MTQDRNENPFSAFTLEGRIADEPLQGAKSNVIVDCGWGRLIFAHTFGSPSDIPAVLSHEDKGRRDVAFYVRDPHIALAAAPQTLFLDPSYSFRIDLNSWQKNRVKDGSGLIVRAASRQDLEAINRLYLSRGMVPLSDDFGERLSDHPSVITLVAEEAGGGLVGVVMGVDHRAAFDDPENGCSLWALAVDPQAPSPGIGESLLTELTNLFKDASRSFMDLSVMHDNEQAIALYEKLGFRRVPVYCLKRKNPINEKLFVGPQPEGSLNIYARIVVDEARRRGIAVDIEDSEAGLFRLSLGGRVISCRESLSDMTSAVALSRCDDKRLTRRLLQKADLRVPAQVAATDDSTIRSFLECHDRVVVKPARGEMGRGVAVDLTTWEDVSLAVSRARALCDDVILEEFVDGQDLRVIVIDDTVVAAALRVPPVVRGDGVHTIIELIDKQSRRRAAATGGESEIPLDEETERCIESSGQQMLDVPEKGQKLIVRKTANLHAGGTIHDATSELSPVIAEAAIAGARALDIPVVGFDFIVPDAASDDYVIIEANERPGLANHQPQPTAERFIDYLFPQTRTPTKTNNGVN